MMNTQYFIDKFEAIPEYKWCIKIFSNGEGQNCANGHCGVIGKSVIIGELFFSIIKIEYIDTPESIALFHVFSKLSIPHPPVYMLNNPKQEYSLLCAAINNGDIPEYQQETPKQRVLAALRDILLLEEQEKALEQAKEVLKTDELVELAVDSW